MLRKLCTKTWEQISLKLVDIVRLTALLLMESQLKENRCIWIQANPGFELGYFMFAAGKVVNLT